MPDPIMAYSNMMRVQIDRLNAIAQNSSNVNSTGYLQETSQVGSQHFLAILQGAASAGHLDAHHITKLGTIKVTGNSTDMALSSDHWFVVRHGTSLYITRNGSFSVNAEGELRLGDYSVMGEAGPIVGLSKEFFVSGDAMLYAEGSPIDKLQLVRVERHAKLTSIGNGVYRAETIWDKGGQPAIVQGALNNSNVDIQSDMTRMIEITRQIESLQRAMSAYNDVLNVGINQLGK